MQKVNDGALLCLSPVEAVVRVSGPELAEAESDKAAARARAVAAARRRGLFSSGRGGGGSSGSASSDGLCLVLLLPRWLPPRRGPEGLPGRLRPLPLGAHPRNRLRLRAARVVGPERGTQARRERGEGPTPPPPAPRPAAGGVPLPRDRALCPLRLQRLRLLLPVPARLRDRGGVLPRDEGALRDRRRAEVVPGKLAGKKKCFFSFPSPREKARNCFFSLCKRTSLYAVSFGLSRKRGRGALHSFFSFRERKIWKKK